MTKQVSILAFVLWIAISAVAAQQPVGEERVRVNLVYVETLVTDSKGNTVPGLTEEDFVLSVGGREQEIDVFDANCTGGSVPDPEPNAEGSFRAHVGGPQVTRRIVFAFDYNSIPKPTRQRTLDFARYMLARGKTVGEEVMVVALADGVRIESGFTADPAKLDATLQRMEVDLTLWARDFGGGVSGRSYFESLSTLMDVLAQYDGPKAVVLFSEWMGQSSTNDLWFFEVAHHAAAARAAIYPVFTAGLDVGGPSGGPPGLARLANESGGRTTYRTNDLSLGYARAQRDMSCRYGVGFYVGEDVTRPRRVGVRVVGAGLQTRSPEQIKFFTEKEQLDNRLRAAITDPEHFESPYVRAHAFPVTPLGKKSWEALLMLHFRMVVDPGGNDLDIAATLQKETATVARIREQLNIDPTNDGTPQPVTIYANRKLKPGRHKLVVALSKSGNDVPQTTSIEFSIPEVPEEQVILRGPLLAKVLRSGVLIRNEKGDAKRRAAIDELIGDEGSFQPLLIHQIELADTVLAGWKACTLGKKAPDGAIERRVLDREGKTVHEFEPLPIAMTGKKPLCQGGLDTVEGRELGPGAYRLEVVVKDAEGDELARGLAPLRVMDASNGEATHSTR